MKRTIEFYIYKFITIAIGALIFLVMQFTTIVSLKENEPVAALRAFLLSLFLPLPYFLLGFISFKFQAVFSLVLIALTAATVILLVLPFKQKNVPEDDTPKSRIDERDIMFSRRLLKEGSEKFEEYYKNNPDKKILDDKFRAKPGLMAKEASNYDPFLFSAAEANFTTVKSLKPNIDGAISNEKVLANPGDITHYIKHWTFQLGAVSVGITKLKNYHLYSVKGRGERYGQTIKREHEFAIAFTVEMDKFMMDCAPYAPTVMESAQQYLTSGTIAVQVAEFIRNLGYPARAHIDGNYEVVCPLVARDAGLGEIGRIGLLMTPELGPRVRISVVTTDLPLITDDRKHDHSMIDFCARCKKCAEVCPPRAISFVDRKEIDGVKRWLIHSEACFTYWCAIGTDCGRCISVCPYSHPDNLLHNLVRKGVRNSSILRKLAIKMDDFFYGKKPEPADFPDWMRLNPVTTEEPAVSKTKNRSFRNNFTS